MNNVLPFPARQSDKTQRVRELALEIVDGIMAQTEGPAESEVITEALAVAAGYFLVIRAKYEDYDLSDDALRDRVEEFIRNLAGYTQSCRKQMMEP